MKKKCNILALCSFVIAIAIFIFTFYLFHYLGPEGNFEPICHVTPEKPFVTLLFGVWGVCFLFAGVMSWLVGMIFFSKEKKCRKAEGEYPGKAAE